MIDNRIDIYRTHRRRRSQAKIARPTKAYKLEEKRKVRVGLLLVLFMVCFAVLSYRAFDLTVLRHEQLVELADQMHGTRIKLTQPRGDILDRNHEPLAVRVTMDSVFAEPRRIKNREQAAQLLSEKLQMDRQELMEKLSSRRGFVWIKRKISPAESAAFDALELPRGVGRVSESARQYPYGRLAASVVGYADIDTVGLEGIELQYDKILAGQAGQMVGQRDARGRIFFPDGVTVMGFRQGGSIRLTLDAKIQWFAEDALDHVVKQFRPAGAWVIVINVHTGEILAVANRPTYNPGAPAQYAPAHRRNRAITDMYEPGSTLKPLTVAMALEEGEIRLDETIYCENGLFHYSDAVIHDHKPHGWLTPARIVQASSNIGAAKIALKLGKKKIYTWLCRFGFGRRTGVDLPGKVSGRLRSYKNWYPISTCTHGYGHGISVTAIQLLAAISALGNGGRLMQPYIVAETIAHDGRVLFRQHPRILERVVSERVAEQVLAMMRLVTREGGTAILAALEGFDVAGKTGTAFKVDPRTRTYHPTKRVSSFVGLVPGNRPQLGIVVVVDEPAGSKPGGICAAPAFRAIAERSLRYLGIYAGTDDPDNQIDQAIRRQKLVRVKQPSRSSLDRRVAGNNHTPDFIGLTMRRAMNLAEESGIELSMMGSGVAVQQNPSPGRRLPNNKRVKVEFVPPS